MANSSPPQASWHNLCGILAHVNCRFVFGFLLIWTILLAGLIAVGIESVVLGRPSSWRTLPWRPWALLVRHEVYVVSLHDFAAGECVIAGAFLSEKDAMDATEQLLELDYQGRQLWHDDIRHAVLDSTEHGLLIRLPQGHESFTGIMAAVHKMRLR